MRALVWLGLAAGCSGPTGEIVIRETRAPQGLAVDGQFLYWVTQSSSVKRLPLDGSGEPVTLYTGGAAAHGFAIDATSAYLGQAAFDTQQKAIVRIPLAGGPAVTLTSSWDALDLAIAGDTLFAAAQDLIAMPVGGGAVTVLHAAATGSPTAVGSVAVDADLVYAATGDAILYIRSHTGAGDSTITGCGNLDLATSADAVFCVSNRSPDGQSGEIVRLDKTTWTLRVLARPQEPHAIAVDGDHVYWTDRTHVVRANLDGSDQTVLADDQNSPGAIAVSATDVYWTTGAGEIRRIAK